MRLVFLGRAGSGKGAIAQRVCPLLGIPHISMGDLLREEVAKKTRIGVQAEQCMNRGELVPDELTFKILRRRLAEPDAAEGFVLDGFPRDIRQALELEKITDIDAAVYLNVPEKILFRRLSARIECRKCSRIYNLLFLKPNRPGVCDACGGGLYQRSDDRPAAIKTRLHRQWRETQAVLRFYGKKRVVCEVRVSDIRETPEVNANRVLKALGLKQRL